MFVCVFDRKPDTRKEGKLVASHLQSNIDLSVQDPIR